MPAKRKRTDEQIIAAYEEHGSVWRAGGALGVCGQTVHERLVKLGRIRPMNVFAPEEEKRLREEYVVYRDAGKLDDLARDMGRTKHFICRKARAIGLTDRRAPKVYNAVWKYLPKEAAQAIFNKFKASSMGMGKYCATHGYDDLGFSRCMQFHFAEEWEHVLELKVPKQSLYRLGRSLEYRVRDDARANGYFALRSPASKSPVDIFAVRPGVVLMIQCKRGGTLPVGEWNELWELAMGTGALPVLAAMPKARGIDYYLLVGPKDGSKRRQPYAPLKGGLADIEAESAAIRAEVAAHGTSATRAEVEGGA